MQWLFKLDVIAGCVNCSVLLIQVFPIIIYFSAVINIFYYWGLMQFVVCKIAWLMQFTMGTTAIESLNAACNIFIGMVSNNTLCL